MTFTIRIPTPTDAQKLNKIAESYPFDIWLHGKTGTADAKSLLGVMLMTLENEIKLVVDDDVDTKHLIKDITEYLV